MSSNSSPREETPTTHVDRKKDKKPLRSKRKDNPTFPDPFGPIGELPSSGSQRKRQPPPRPPPPKSAQQQPSHRNISIFGRRKTQKPPATAIVRPLPPSVNVPTGTLIDLNSHPQSIFGDPKKANFISGSSSSLSSHVESGFEDDFGSLLSSGASSPWGDQYSSTSDWTSPGSAPSPDLKDPFTPHLEVKPPSKLRVAPKIPAPTKQPAPSRAYCNPTIICVQPTSKPKPARPPPPKVNQSFPDGSPPMPSVPPPPPPANILDILSSTPQVPPRPQNHNLQDEDNSCCVATYGYESDHPDDLNFKEGDVILRIQRVNEEWMKGELNGCSGLFPSSYVHIKVPPKEEDTSRLMKVICTYPYTAETWDDLSLKEGDIITVTNRINKDWLFGTCEGKKGQFPANFVQDISEMEDFN